MLRIDGRIVHSNNHGNEFQIAQHKPRRNSVRVGGFIIGKCICTRYGITKGVTQTSSQHMFLFKIGNGVSHLVERTGGIVIVIIGLVP